MKTLKIAFAGALVASTIALAAPTPASALSIHVGPRGVGIGLGHRGYHRDLRHRPIYHRGFRHRRFRRF